MGEVDFGTPHFGTPDFGTMTTDKFILYQSQLSTGGSKYTKLERFPMRPVEGTAIPR